MTDLDGYDRGDPKAAGYVEDLRDQADDARDAKRED
jgi:hypothetical protein